VRLAFLGPLPPAPTGVADYDAEVLELLAGRHQVDAFHQQAEVETSRLPSACAVHPAASFLARARAQPYDAAIYQMGNGPGHAFLYPLLARVPGLLVLHDLVLHHARARMFLDAPEVRAYAAAPWDSSRRQEALGPLAAYRDELAASYPGQADRLAEAQLATTGDLLPYAYPLFRLPAQASRVVGAHNDFMVEAVRQELPEAAVVRLVMPMAEAPVADAEVEALRRRYELGPDDLVVASFGLLTREKRIETVARAVARAAETLPRLRLVLVGPVPDREILEDGLARWGVRARTVITGRVPFAELPAHIALADVVAHLRYPTARETSAALLRVLAQARPAIVSDLEHLAAIPEDAVVRADVTDEEGEVTRAILRLGGRPAWRASLGARAADWIRREHAPGRCAESYEAAIERTAARPDPAPLPWPPNWPDQASHSTRNP
jgi:glycosyltransferase involved in cell wall biosynthesis